MIIDKKNIAISEFYKNFGSDNGPKNIEKIIDIYINTVDMISSYSKQIKDNLNISKIESYRVIPFKTVSTNGAFYSLNDILYIDDITNKLNIKDKKFEERCEVWNKCNNDTKVSLLISNNIFIQLTSIGDYSLIENSIVDADICDMKNKEYEDMVDYILYDNKIIFLKPIDYMPYNKEIILKNIVVDYDVPQQYIGKNIGVLYNNIISKPEYRDFLQMAITASAGGPTMVNIKKSFLTLFPTWSDSNICDMYSAEGNKKDYWLGTNAILTPFDFLISIPVEFFNNEEKISIFKDFLNIIKPSYSDYFIAWAQDIIDEIIINGEMFSGKLSDSVSHTLNINDDVHSRVFQSDTYVLNMQQQKVVKVAFDSDDTESKYDSYFATDIIYQFAADGSSSGYGDYAGLNHITFPEFPVDFKAFRDNLTGKLTVSFKDNSIGTTMYEIYRNDDIIKTVVAAGNMEYISFVDNSFEALPSGIYEYYAKSVYEYDVNLPEFTQYSQKSAISKIIKE